MADQSKPKIDRVTYWKMTLRRSLILLAVWFVTGYVLSIFLAGPLNSINFGGIPFGFWMAQQGSIFVFIALILIYVLSMQQLDQEAGVEEIESETPPPSPH